MKTFTFRWLICLSLLFFVTPCLYAQRFSFWNYMYTGWSSANLGGNVKKPSTKTFELSDALYNHQWTLTTDGKCAGQNGETKCIHVGTGSSYSQYLILKSTTSFSFVDVVRVATAVTKSRKYTLDVVLMKGEENLKASLVDEVQKDGVTTRIFEFDNVKAIGDAAKLKVEMVGDKYEKGALCLYYIDVASRLSDIVALSSQHIKPGDTYSYQVQRTFSKDYWNTICLPFDVEESQVQELFGNTHRLRTFTGNVDANGTMIFAEAKEIKAGVPYLLKPAKTVESPIFTNVIYTNAEPTVVSDPTGAFSFVGAFNPTELQTDGTELFLGNGDKLYKPSSSHNRMNGMRAFFRINKNSNTLSNGKYAIRFDDETTAVMDILPELKSHNSRIYNLQGMIVGDSQPLPPGIYVKNGKKICVCK